MSLLDEIRAEAVGHGPTCTYRRLIIEMHPELDKAAREAMSEGIPRTAITRFLVKRSGVTPSAADRHLAGKCRCQP